MVREETSLRLRLEAVSAALNAAVEERDALIAERNALREEVGTLTLRLQSHKETLQTVLAERNLLWSEGCSLREEVTRLREQLRGLRNPTYPRP